MRELRRGSNRIQMMLSASAMRCSPGRWDRPYVQRPTQGTRTTQGQRGLYCCISLPNHVIELCWSRFRPLLLRLKGLPRYSVPATVLRRNITNKRAVSYCSRCACGHLSQNVDLVRHFSFQYLQLLAFEFLSSCPPPKVRRAYKHRRRN